MKRTAVTMGALLLTVFAVASTASAASGDYVAGTGDALVLCQAEDAVGACFGGQTFAVATDATSVDIDVEDDLAENNPPGAFYQFRDANDEILDETGGFCGSTTASVPANAVTLQVFVGTAFAPLDCSSNPIGVATTGTIVASFSS